MFFFFLTFCRYQNRRRRIIWTVHHLKGRCIIPQRGTGQVASCQILVSVRYVFGMPRSEEFLSAFFRGAFGMRQRVGSTRGSEISAVTCQHECVNPEMADKHFRVYPLAQQKAHESQWPTTRLQQQRLQHEAGHIQHVSTALQSVKSHQGPHDSNQVAISLGEVFSGKSASLYPPFGAHDDNAGIHRDRPKSPYSGLPGAPGGIMEDSFLSLAASASRHLRLRSGLHVEVFPSRTPDGIPNHRSRANKAWPGFYRSVVFVFVRGMGEHHSLGRMLDGDNRA